MVTKDLLKTEIDRVQDAYLEVLYKIISGGKGPLQSILKEACDEDD